MLALYQEDMPGKPMTLEKCQRTFQEFTSKPEKGQIVVFDIDNTIVGYAILVFFWSNEFGGDLVDVDELFVQKNYRRRGIGQLFFQWLEKSWHNKAIAYSLQTSPDNEGAIALYQRMGFAISDAVYFIKEP
jgi:GNAT superfamily N-acetyltransferase